MALQGTFSLIDHLLSPGVFIRIFEGNEQESLRKQKGTELPPEQTPQQQIPTHSSLLALFFFIFLTGIHACNGRL
jgi:hypothetical protein